MKILRQFFIQPYIYILITLTGIVFKFYHLDNRLFWIDEISTIQHTSGIKDKDYQKRIPINEIVHIQSFTDLYNLKKQQYSFSSEFTGLFLAPQMNPLHYPLLMIWYRIVGDNPIDFRLFSVWIFILTLPSLFLLSRHLFKSSLAGWIAVSLYSLSPIIHLFAQEARYYILWSYILIMLHYLFLLCVQHNNSKLWAIYSLIAALSLYASPVSIIIIFGHWLFIMMTNKKLFKVFIYSATAGGILYLPYAVFLYFQLDKIMTTLSWHTTSHHYTSFWFPLMGQCFYLFSVFTSTLDFFYVFDASTTSLPPEAGSYFLINFIILCVVITAFVFLFIKTEKETKYFLVLIVLPGLLFFYLLDIVRHGMTSWWWRYLIFTTVGIILVMTNFLYKRIEKGSLFATLVFLTLAACGISSLMHISESKHWFLGKQWDHYTADAQLFSSAEKPLLITDFSYSNGMINFMVMVLECKSENIDILRASPDIANVKSMIRDKKYSDIYVVHGSDKLIRNLRTQLGSNMDSLRVKGTSTLWKIHFSNTDG